MFFFADIKPSCIFFRNEILIMLKAIVKSKNKSRIFSFTRKNIKLTTY